MSLKIGYTKDMQGDGDADPFSLATVAKDNVFIYVDGATGNDRNNGRSPAKAVKSLDKALSLLPNAWRKQCKIFIAPGSYPLFTPNLNPGIPLGSEASPLAIIGGYTQEAFFTESVGSPFGDIVTFAGPPLAPGVERNKYITCLSGANAGIRCSVKENGGNDITPVGSFFFGPIAIGDEFAVEVESVEITTNILNIVQGTIGWKGIKITADGALQINGAPTLCWEGCTIDGVNSLFIETFSYTRFFSGEFLAFRAWLIDGPDNPFDITRFFAGLNFKNLPGAGFSDNLFDGVFLFDNCNNVFFDGADCFMPNVVSRNNTNLFLKAGCVFSTINFFGGNRGYSEHTDVSGYAEFAGIDLSNPTGNGLNVFDGGVAILDSDCAGNSSNVGVNILETGTVVFDPSGAGNMPTGAFGDANVGATNFAPGSWAIAPLFTTGYGEVNLGGPTGNRITPFGV